MPLCHVRGSLTSSLAARGASSAECATTRPAPTDAAISRPGPCLPLQVTRPHLFELGNGVHTDTAAVAATVQTGRALVDQERGAVSLPALAPSWSCCCSSSSSCARHLPVRRWRARAHERHRATPSSDDPSSLVNLGVWEPVGRCPCTTNLATCEQKKTSASGQELLSEMATLKESKKAFGTSVCQ